MSLTLVQYPDQMQKINSVNDVCKSLSSTPHYEKLGKNGIFAVVSYAMSLEIDPLEALNGALYYLNGKVGMSAELMARMVRRHGHSIRKDPKSDNTNCILHATRRDNGDEWTTSFSLEDAKRAGIYKGAWEKYPGAMCYNRAMSFMFRQLFPDLAKGAGYCPDELEEIALNDKKQEKVVPITQTFEIEEIKKTYLSVPQQAQVKAVFEKYPGLKKRVLKGLKLEDSPQVLEQIEDINFDKIMLCAEAEKVSEPKKEVAVGE